MMQHLSNKISSSCRYFEEFSNLRETNFPAIFLKIWAMFEFVQKRIFAKAIEIRQKTNTLKMENSAFLLIFSVISLFETPHKSNISETKLN